MDEPKSLCLQSKCLLVNQTFEYRTVWYTRYFWYGGLESLAAVWLHFGMQCSLNGTWQPCREFCAVADLQFCKRGFYKAWGICRGQSTSSGSENGTIFLFIGVLKCLSFLPLRNHFDLPIMILEPLLTQVSSSALLLGAPEASLVVSMLWDGCLLCRQDIYGMLQRWADARWLSAGQAICQSGGHVPLFGTADPWPCSISIFSGGP